MKPWILLGLVCGLAGAAQAQDVAQGSGSRQERLLQDRGHHDNAFRRGSEDARQLDRLQRMRQRSDERVRRLRQPEQSSRPANAKNSSRNVVKNQ